MISNTLYLPLTHLDYHFLTLFLKIIGLQGKVPNMSAGNWFQCWMFLFTKEYFPISVLCLLLLIFRS